MHRLRAARRAPRARPAEVGLEDLPDVHARRHAERVEHDVDRRAVLEVRHVLFGQDAGDDALVAVAAGHLVADLELALDGDVDLHHLDDARRQLVALLERGDLLAEDALRSRSIVLLAGCATSCSQLLLGLAPRRPAISAQYLRRDLRRAASSSSVVALLERGPCPCRRRACPPSSCRRAARASCA